MKLDTLHHVEVPEGVELQLRVAGPLDRGTAYMIDLIIRLVIYFVLAIAVGLVSVINENLAPAVFGVCFFFIEWFYPVYYEVWRGGQTPGKKALELIVVQEGDQPIGLRGSMIRNLLRVVDFLPFGYAFGLVSCLFTRQFQRLGDLAAGTVVIYGEPKIKRVWERETIAPIAPMTPLTRDEQAAVVAYAERVLTWTPERQAELADHASALTGATGKPGRDRLLGIAQWVQEGTEG